MTEEFDSTVFVLGSLCRRGHDWNGTGKSLRYRKHKTPPCVECLKITKQAWEAKRAPVAQEPIEGMDTTKYFLGALCKRGHDWNGTGKSLRRINDGRSCVRCRASEGLKERETPDTTYHCSRCNRDVYVSGWCKTRSHGRPTGTYCLECTRERRKQFYDPEKDRVRRQRSEPRRQKRKQLAIENITPDERFDSSVFVLGTLCKRGHDFQETGQSLRVIRDDFHCADCRSIEGKKERIRKAILPRNNPMPAPGMAPHTFFLGALCKHGHDWHNTGRSARYLKYPVLCVECSRKKLRERPQPNVPIEKRREYMRRWQSKNKEYVQRKNKEYRMDPVRRKRLYKMSADRHRHKMATDPQYRKQYIEKATIYQREAMKTRPWLRVAANIRNHFFRVLQGKRRDVHWHKMVGYTLAELKSHLERQFSPEMTWANYGSYWHVDHIIPLSAFRFSGSRDPMIKRAWALKNLRPLPSSENISKGAKLVLMPPDA